MVSVIIPSCNHVKYIRQCLDSVVNQTYRDMEIICIDQNSTDGSYDILKEYEAKDERVRLFKYEVSELSLSRNFGMDHSSGEYYMFMDADDWIDKGALEVAVGVMEEDEADIVMWPYVREFDDRSLPKNIFNEDKIIFEKDDVIEKLHRRNIGLVRQELSQVENADSLSTAWGKLYRASIIREKNLRFIDTRKIGTYEDGMFNLYLMYYVNRVVFINRHFYHYRKYNKKSVTYVTKPNLPNQWAYLFGLMEDYIRENNLPDIYTEALDNRIALSVMGLGLNIIKENLSEEEKRAKIQGIISRDEYRKAFERLKFEYFSLHWKVFFKAAKRQNIRMLMFLLYLIQRIIGRA